MTIHKPDARSVLLSLGSTVAVFAILIGIDRMINRHVDLTFIGLIFTIMLWYRLSELMGLNLKRAGWKGMVIQVICTVLIVIGYSVATMH
ncbi:hypothetical protein [Burkholderia sp.]|uniref:hypothetical protein n=1 Tax=Burkholderia sp. TaxID=36773 RepID=UPI0025C5A826|nr:hypothetical protein [Burkholderia sp.]MBS6358945.1 hypothetical protein [Burkholderia sp.]